MPTLRRLVVVYALCLACAAEVDYAMKLQQMLGAKRREEKKRGERSEKEREERS